MAFSITKILKGLRIYKENTLTPDNIDIVPNGTASTTTTIQSSQTANRTLTLPDVTDTLVAKTTTDVLTNKSLSDSTTLIVDAGDNTKQIAFDAAGTAGTKTTITGSQTVNRVLTLPDATDTLVGKATTDTLTNKSIDATTNTISNIANAEIKAGANIDVAKLGTGVVDNTEFNYLNGVTGQLSGNAQSATLQNKTLDNTNAITVKDNSFTMQDNADTTKQLTFELSGITTATSRILTVPDASTTIVGTDATQTLTNKTLTSPVLTTPSADIFSTTEQGSTPSTPAAGVRKLYSKADGFYQLTSGGVETKLGVGTGNAVNFITNSDAETDTTGWSTYADAAGTRPVDGTGGSPNSTWTRSTSSPLNGSGQFLWTKSGAANRQGEGVAYTFSIPLEFRGSALSISIPYIVTSGTFTAGTSSTDSDLIVYCYDVTNAALVEPSSIKLLSNSTSVPDTFTAQVQFPVTCTSARLIIHTATTSTSNYTVAFDDVYVGPSRYAYGTPVTDWVAWTPTGSWVTNTTYTGFKRRVGDSMEYDVTVTTSGAPTAATLTITLPETIDTAKLTSSSSTQEFGLMSVLDSGVTQYTGAVGYNSTTSVRPLLNAASGSYTQPAVVNATAPITFGASDSVHMRFTVPIVGLSSSVQMSDQTDSRVVAARTYRATNQTGVNTNNSNVKINIDTIDNTNGTDTHSGVSTANSKYTVIVPGWYHVNGTISVTGTNILAAQYGAKIYKNGSAVSLGQYAIPLAGAAISLSVSDVFYCNAGDYLELYIYGAGNNSTSTLTVSGGAQATYLSLMRVSGPNQIAANELVAARAYAAADITGVNPNNSYVKINLDSRDFDSHSFFDTSAKRFNIPVAGTYRISYNLLFNGTNILNNTYAAAIYKNNALVSNVCRAYGSTAGQAIALSGSVTLKLNVGDYIEPYVYGAGNNSVSTLTASGDARYTTMCVERLGF